MLEPLSSPKVHVLVVDDDEDVLTSARLLLGRHEMKVSLARNPAEAWSALAADPPDVVLLDLNFSRASTSGEEGLDWLNALIAHDPEAVVVVATGHSGVNIAVAAMRAGASDFVMKPWRNDRLVATLAGAVELRRRRAKAVDAAAPEAAETLPPLLGESPAIQRVRALIERVAPTGASVLILGEAGTGKSLIARHLHHHSGASGAFVVLDLEALAEEDLGARLTAALAQARGGTLCLEEVGGLSRLAQARIVAALEGLKDRRLVATSRRRRESLKGPGGLSDDLLFRLNTVEILAPALSDRDRDADLLAEHFLRLFAARYGRPAGDLAPDAAAMIRARVWAGDVRALRQAMERCVIFAEGERYEVSDISEGEAIRDESLPAGVNLAQSERAVISQALERNGFNVSHAARQLGLSRGSLYRRMARHGL